MGARVDRIVALRPPVLAPVGTPDDARLAEQASHAGRMLEAAYKAGDRDLALIWQQAMFAIVNLRRARRFGPDIQTGGEVRGG